MPLKINLLIDILEESGDIYPSVFMFMLLELMEITSEIEMRGTVCVDIF